MNQQIELQNQQSTSQHSMCMDERQQIACVSLPIDVLKLDIWTWLYGNDLGFTFELAQHRQMWTQLD